MATARLRQRYVNLLRLLPLVTNVGSRPLAGAASRTPARSGPDGLPDVTDAPEGSSTSSTTAGKVDGRCSTRRAGAKPEASSF